MRKSLSAVAGVAALSLAACTSSSTSGTETFTSVLTGKAALGNSFPLSYTGPVTTAGTFSTNGPGPKPGQQRTFTTQAGKLVLQVVKVPVNTQGTVDTALGRKECEFQSTTVVDWKAVSVKSTGSFRGAAGSGTVTVTFRADGPKLLTGACNESPSAQPLAAGAFGSFTGKGSLTVK